MLRKFWGRKNNKNLLKIVEKYHTIHHLPPPSEIFGQKDTLINVTIGRLLPL
jgi:hypothetical protein